MIRLADAPWAPVAQGHPGAEVVRSVRVALRGRTATITEWPPKWFLNLSAADRPLRCMVLFWLFFVLVLSEAVLVLVLARSIVRLYHSILFNALLRREFSNG